MATRTSLLAKSGIGQLTAILDVHLQSMKDKDAEVEKIISSAITASSLHDAKKKALQNETALLLSIMEDIGEMNSFLENIILIENLFNSVYQPHKKQQEEARTKYAKNISKYENKPKCESEASSFVELIFGGQTHISSFQTWLDKVIKQCDIQNVIIKENSSAKVKKIERAFYKAFYVYSHQDGFKQMTDILRCSFVFDDFDNLYKCFSIIELLAEQTLGGILRVKDRFHPNTMPFGYRDLLINIICPESKIVAEIQLHFAEFYKYKKISHKMYKRARLFERDTCNLAYEYSTKFMRPKIGTFKVYQVSKEEVGDEAEDNKEEKAEDIAYDKLLKSWGLEQYINIFKDEGWDETTDWKELTDEDLKDLGFSKGHTKKFRRRYQAWLKTIEEENKSDVAIYQEQVYGNTQPKLQLNKQQVIELEMEGKQEYTTEHQAMPQRKQEKDYDGVIVWGANRHDDIYTSSDGTGNPWKKISGKLKCVSIGNDGTIWGCNTSDNIYRYSGDNKWEQIQGSLMQISCGYRDHVWGCNKNDDIYSYKNGRGWKKIDGKLVQLSCGPDGEVWGVNRSDNIYTRKGEDGSWTQITGQLTHVSIGQDGTVWGVNRQHNIYKYLGNREWQKMSGSAVGITVVNKDVIYVVNRNDEIYKYGGNNDWNKLPGLLKYISAATISIVNVTVWGANKHDDIYTSHDGTGSPWTKISGKLKCVSIGNDGTVWGCNMSDNIYRYSGDHKWEQIQGSLMQISCGYRDHVWGCNKNDDIYSYKNGRGWKKIDGKLVQLSCGPDGEVWGVNRSDNIYTRKGEDGSWTQIPGQLTHISIGQDGTVWGVNRQHNIYKYLGNRDWKKMSGAAVGITVVNKDIIYVVNRNDEIYKYGGNDKWHKLPGLLKYISAATLTNNDLNGKQFHISVTGNEDGRSTAIGFYLTVHGSMDQDKRDKNTFFVIGHNDKGKVGIWKLHRFDNNPNLYMIQLETVSDGRTTGKGQWLAVHGSTTNDTRDKDSVYVLITREAQKATIWELRKCNNGSYYIGVYGNKDGRKKAVGYFLTIHASDAKDKRDGNSFMVHVRKDDHKATQWGLYHCG